MIQQELEKKIAQLESINDQMYSELCYVDQLMRMVGFSEGLATVKETAKEIARAQSEVEEYEGDMEDVG